VIDFENENLWDDLAEFVKDEIYEVGLDYTCIDSGISRDSLTASFMFLTLGGTFVPSDLGKPLARLSDDFVPFQTTFKRLQSPIEISKKNLKLSHSKEVPFEATYGGNYG